MFKLIYWDTFSKEHDLQGAWQDSTMHAIWPSSVDSDACFAAAGFTEFEDTDSDWDANWATLIERIVSGLSRYGEPVIQNSVSASVRTSWWDRIWSGRFTDSKQDLTLVQQMVLTTTENSFETAVVGFGLEANLTLICGDGHPILWLQVKDGTDWSFSALIDAISVDCRQQRLSLDWQQLIPLSALR